MASKTINFKRGDTFSLSCTRVNSAGEAVDITGLTLTSQVRSDAFVDDLTTAIVSGAAGTFTLSATATDSAAWPIAKLNCDVRFVGDATETTETFIINNVAEITRAG